MERVIEYCINKSYVGYYTITILMHARFQGRCIKGKLSIIKFGDIEFPRWTCHSPEADKSRYGVAGSKPQRQKVHGRFRTCCPHANGATERGIPGDTCAMSHGTGILPRLRLGLENRERRTKTDTITVWVQAAGRLNYSIQVSIGAAKPWLLVSNFVCEYRSLIIEIET